MTIKDDTKVFDLVESIDRKLDAKSKADDARRAADESRFMALESLGRDHEHRLDGHDAKHKEHDERHARYDRQLNDQSNLLVTLGQATARAVDSALKSQQEATRTKEECIVIVESAIRMHGASISSTVQEAVRAAVQPLVTKTDAQDVTLGLHTRNDEAQNLELRAQSAELRQQSAMQRDHGVALSAICSELGIAKHVSGATGSAQQVSTIRQLIKVSKWSGLGAGAVAFAFLAKTFVDLFLKH